MEAKYLIYGNVWTGDKNHSVKHGFAVGYDGKILAVGDKPELELFRGHGTQVFQYPYGLLVPGFTEGHAHVSSSYEVLCGPYVNGESIAACQEQVYVYVHQHPDEPVIEGTGFDPGLFGQGGPTR
ncbi:MAG: metal-dependent hydrolase, partial [Chordicoccus sp.]